MNTDPIKLTFKEGFVGEMTSPTGTVKIGDQENGMRPYHLLYGALASCFYATFLGIIEKMRLKIDGASLEVSGTKRDEVPTTLESAKILLIVENATDQEKIKKAASLAAKHCSIHETILKVAEIELEVQFS